MKTSSRRQFLRGTGGAILALPFLPSLSRQSHATERPLPFFVGLQNQQGAVHEVNRVPQTTAFDQARSYAGREIRRGSLTIETGGSRASLSPVLSASAGTLTPRLASKLNYLQGFDIPTETGHNQTIFGNLGRKNGRGDRDIAESPTIDQIMAWSSAFYPNIEQIRQRSVNWGHLAYGWSNPAQRSGGVEKVRFTGNAFDAVFVDSNPDDEGSSEDLLVDRVLENYQRLRDSNRRLSSNDRRRLDEHMQRLFELQRASRVVASCGDVDAPPSSGALANGRSDLDGDFQAEVHQRVHMETIAAGIICGTCRVWTIGLSNCAPGQLPGKTFHDAAHNYERADKQEILVAANQTIFERVFLHLASLLDVDSGDGTTYLDHGLVFWNNENSHHPHKTTDFPVLTAGSAGGYFETGYHLDYRRRDIDPGSWSAGPRARMGLTYHQLLANILDGMGVAKSEYDLFGHGGYGDLHVDEGRRGDVDYKRDYAAAVDVVGQPLPWWVRGV